MTTYIGLARVSTKRQLNKGNSLEDQINSIKSYADKLGGEVSEITQIQVSGSKMKLNSSVLQKVFLTAKEEGSEVILSKLDRLSRDELALHQVKQVANEIGIQIHLAGLGKTIQEMSSMEFSMLAMFAQHERENTIARIRAASKKSKGSFGRLVDAKEANKKSVVVRNRIIHEWEKQVGIKNEIQDAIQLLKTPTLERVSLVLNGKGLVTPTGRVWTTGSLQKQVGRLGFKNLKAML
jgi:DNA invertase Pin-like site-specific DNA recombinase